MNFPDKCYNEEITICRWSSVCVYPVTREGGLLLSGGAWDPKWGFDFIFFTCLFSNSN